MLAVKRIVWRNKGSNQKLVTIPNSVNIEEGDKILITKVEDDEK